MFIFRSFCSRRPADMQIDCFNVICNAWGLASVTADSRHGNTWNLVLIETSRPDYTYRFHYAGFLIFPTNVFVIFLRRSAWRVGKWLSGLRWYVERVERK